MKIVLLLTLWVLGMQAPEQKTEDQPTMEACEARAHEFNIAKVPDDVVLASAACLRVNPKFMKDPGKAL